MASADGNADNSGNGGGQRHTIRIPIPRNLPPGQRYSIRVNLPRNVSFLNLKPSWAANSLFTLLQLLFLLQLNQGGANRVQFINLGQAPGHQGGGAGQGQGAAGVQPVLHIRPGAAQGQGAVGVHPILQQLQQQQRERMEREEQLREIREREGACVRLGACENNNEEDMLD